MRFSVRAAFAGLLAGLVVPALALPSLAADPEVLRQKVQAIADAYVRDTAPGERATGISVSVSLPGGEMVNLGSGKVSAAADEAPITPETL